MNYKAFNMLLDEFIHLTYDFDQLLQIIYVIKQLFAKELNIQTFITK